MIATYLTEGLDKNALAELKAWIAASPENEDYFIHVETLEEAKEYIDINFDIIKLAHNWHLFLTRDLTGPWYGLGTVTEAMIEGTSVYDLAYNWAHGVDITFTSKHTR